MLKRKVANEHTMLEHFKPGFSVLKPDNWGTGVVFASPHSGRIYPKQFLRQSPLNLKELRKNEDVFVDTLFEAAVSQGAPLIRALFPRCYVDVNRAADEMPTAWTASTARQTPRAEMGLGVVPSIIAQDQPIYKSEPSLDICHARLNRLYHPYHNRLRALLNEAKSHAGSALLIDCHSMPGFSSSGDRRPDIILGDRYGVSCHPETMSRIEDVFTAQGFRVVRNHPYAGGYVTAHYGRPEEGIEALQIEINRDLYLNAVTLKPNKGYSRLAAQLQTIIGDIISGFDADTALAAQ